MNCNTTIRRILTIVLLLVCCHYMTAAPKGDTYRRGKNLYDKGMLEMARATFESADNDPLCHAWSVLCAVKLKAPNCDALVGSLDGLRPRTILYSRIHYEYALLLCEKADNIKAVQEFDKASRLHLAPEERCEMLVRRGYCEMELGDYSAARSHFAEAAAIKGATYAPAARFELAKACYVDQDFTEAADWFTLCADDPNFGEMSTFYLLECRFMQKDYAGVVEAGEQLFAESSPERQVRLSRILSESYMVLGNNAKAQEYLAKENLADGSRSDEDCFHAGSVLYAAGDFEGAISYLTRISDFSGRIGQEASLQLGYCYIETHNKLSAHEAFQRAASMDFNPSMTQDAWFNWAKLSYDLNRDRSAFDSFLERWPQSDLNDQIYGYMAVGFLAEKDYAAAVEAFDNVEYLDPTQKNLYLRANYLRAQQLVSGGSWSDAIPYLKAACQYLSKQNSFNQLSRYWLAEAYFRTGDIRSALSVYTDLYNLSALATNPEGSLLPYNIAFCHFRQGNYKTAASWFDRYTSTRTSLFRKEALTLRADCEYSQKNYSQAASLYSKVVAEFPNSDDIYPYYHWGLACNLVGDKVQKVKALEPVLKANPASDYWSAAIYELGRGYVETGQGDKALQTFSLLLENTNDRTYSARALLGTGMVYRSRSDWDKSLGYYKNVVETMRGSEYASDALLAIQSIYQSMEKPEAYLEYVEQNGLNAGQSEYDREQLYFGTAEQLYLASNLKQAANYLNGYLERWPKGSHRSEALYYLADCTLRSGDKEKACTLFKNSLDAFANGKYAEMAMLGCASTSFDLERWSDAYAIYTQLSGCAKLESNAEAAAIGMMRSAYNAKDWDNAVSASDKVLAMNPDAGTIREGNYVKAKSLLYSSRRDEAFRILTALSREASTPEGAEAYYLIIQARHDWGNVETVQSGVYDFASKCGNQMYWLAKAYIVLGDTFYENGNVAQARVTYESIRDGYSPQSDDDDIPAAIQSRLEKLDTISID